VQTVYAANKLIDILPQIAGARKQQFLRFFTKKMREFREVFCQQSYY